MQTTPKSFRLHIGLFGRRNVGKSSLLNAITKQEVSIVSPVAGTTTDPVEKPMEFLPLGPVLFIDTAGVDDVGSLGELRVEKTQKVFDRTDIGILLTEANSWGEYEDMILSELRVRQIPVIIALNKIDELVPSEEIILRLNDLCSNDIKIRLVKAAAKKRIGLDELRQALIDLAPDDFINSPPILRDLVGAGEVAVLVTPIDKEAPKGRLILPEVQAIRDVLDGNAYCVVTQQNQLADALNNLKKPPRLVVTDSQCFKEVGEITPREIPLTSFSILFSRFKGDLNSQAQAAKKIDTLHAGSKVLILEACTHHPIGDDIGREKIPKILQDYVGAKLDISIYSGRDFPDNIKDYELVIHCGACVWNRRAVLSRILLCQKAGVPMTNYGLAIAHCLGLLPRAIEMFSI